MKSKREVRRAKDMVKDNDMVEIEPEDPTITSKKGGKKRGAAMDLNPPTLKVILEIGHGEASDGVLVDDDLNEPTMGEKFESLELLDNERLESHDKEESSLNPKPPSADSVHILLKQALHADDCALLLDCLYTQDEKVVAKSLTLLNPSGVLKLLQSLICIIQSSSLSPEFQLSALQLSSVLDVHYTGVIDDVDDNMTITPLIYESRTSDEEGSDEEEPDGALDGVSDFDGIEDTSE